MLDLQQKKKLIERLVYYSETVNGFPVKPVNIDYWYSLQDDTLQKVYKKWQELYSAIAFNPPEFHENL